jgi:hypothetical protein
VALPDVWVGARAQGEGGGTGGPVPDGREFTMMRL